MFNRIHQKLGTAGFIISIVALVAALGGGAYAASGTSTGKATASAKAKQGKQGKPGKTGPAGPAGAAGAQGPVGPAGPKGDTGANGSNGASGATGAAGVKGATGPTGVTGATGFSGFTKTLPPGETETGTWSLFGSATADRETNSAISFPIPLAESGETGSAFAFSESQTTNEEFGTSGCAGTLEEPTAPPGKLCVYTSEEFSQHASGGVTPLKMEPGGLGEFESFGVSGARLLGPFLEGTSETLALGEAYGTWAVTAPTP
jgi:collagen type I alpha